MKLVLLLCAAAVAAGWSPMAGLKIQSRATAVRMGATTDWVRRFPARQMASVAVLNRPRALQTDDEPWHATAKTANVPGTSKLTCAHPPPQCPAAPPVHAPPARRER